METDDPRQAIRARDVKTRSAAARDLALVGTWDDLPLLVQLAAGEKSSAVRLYAAAAAADVLSRMRGAGGQPALTPEQADQVIAWVKPIDPGTNPSVPMLLSAVPTAAAVDRLGRMLKDPRNGVRAGATTALRRMVLSGGQKDEAAARALAESLLRDRRAPADVTLELAKLVGEAGWLGLEDAVRDVAAAGRPHLAAVEEALSRLALRGDPASWEGLWVSDGLDVLEVNPAPRAPSWLLVYDEVAHRRDGAVPTDAAGLRLIWAPHEGEGRAALQDPSATYWRAENRHLAAAVDELLDDLEGLDLRAVRALAGWLGAVEAAAVPRARGILLLAAGDSADALACLEEAAGQKKPKPDTFWFLARARLARGNREGAKAAVDEFLDKAAKKAKFRKEAEELRASL